MSGAVALVPLHHQSRKYEGRAWATVYEMNNITTLAYVSFITSVHKINIAAWEEGLIGFQKGLELATQLGDRRTAGFCISGLAHMAYYQGYLQRSLELFKQLEALGEAAQDVTHWGTALGALGAINMRWGQWAEAKSYLEKGLPLVVSAGNALAEWNTRVRLGLLQFWLNDHSEAVLSVTAAYAYSTKAPHSSFANTTIYADLLTLLLLLQQGMPAQVPDAPVQVKTLLKRYRQYTRIFPFALPTYWRLRGWAEWINGRSSAAFQSWHEALAEGKRLDVPYEIGMAHKEIGCHLPLDDPQRDYHFNQAVTILTTLEATFDRDQAAQPIISTGG
jgi:tetratricopeptide (TPR) repeat protein